MPQILATNFQDILIRLRDIALISSDLTDTFILDQPSGRRVYTAKEEYEKFLNTNFDQPLEDYDRKHV